MGYTTNEKKKRKCPYCKRIFYLTYVEGTWNELKSEIKVIGVVNTH